MFYFTLLSPHLINLKRLLQLSLFFTIYIIFVASGEIDIALCKKNLIFASKIFFVHIQRISLLRVIASKVDN